MIRPAVLETVEALRRALDSAGVSAADLDAVLLVGGSSRIPLVTQLVSEEFGRSAAVDVDPKGVIAAGAALVARSAERDGGAMARAPAGGATDRATDGDRVPGVGRAPRAERVSRSSVAPVDGASPVGPAALDRPTLRAAGAGPIGPAVRPPKQARPFAAAAEPVTTGRRKAIGLAAGVLALVLLGGAVAFGATRVGADREADASIPKPVVNTVAPSATSDEPPLTISSAPKPAPAAPPAGRGQRRARPPRPRRPRRARPQPPPTGQPPRRAHRRRRHRPPPSPRRRSSTHRRPRPSTRTTGTGTGRTTDRRNRRRPRPTSTRVPRRTRAVRVTVPPPAAVVRALGRRCRPATERGPVSPTAVPRCAMPPRSARPPSRPTPARDDVAGARPHPASRNAEGPGSAGAEPGCVGSGWGRGPDPDMVPALPACGRSRTRAAGVVGSGAQLASRSSC